MSSRCETWVFTVGSREDEAVRDLAVRQALCDEHEDLVLPLRQLAEDPLALGIAGRCHLGEPLEEPAGHRRGDERLAGRDDADRGDEVGRRSRP